MVMLYRKALIRHAINPEPVSMRTSVDVGRKEIDVTFHFANGACNSLHLRAEEAKELVRQLELGILSIGAI